MTDQAFADALAEACDRLTTASFRAQAHDRTLALYDAKQAECDRYTRLLHAARADGDTARAECYQLRTALVKTHSKLKDVACAVESNFISVTIGTELVTGTVEFSGHWLEDAAAVVAYVDALIAPPAKEPDRE